MFSIPLLLALSFLFLCLLPLGRMSYPSGFSRLPIGDGDTQRMARGEGNVGRHVDEDLPSTFEEAFLLADAIGS